MELLQGLWSQLGLGVLRGGSGDIGHGALHLGISPGRAAGSELGLQDGVGVLIQAGGEGVPHGDCVGAKVQA